MGKTNTYTKPSITFEPLRVANAFAHIEQKWADLTVDKPADEATLIGLPYPYVVPSNDPESGFAFNEMYYWDSYFIIRGLLATDQYELAEGMLDNMIFMAKRFHMIPNGSRYYFTSRSQPPFLTSLIFDIYEKLNKSKAWLKEHIWVAENEYHAIWLGDSQPNWRQVYKGLSRYYDINVLDDLAEAESGWDMTTRFNRRCLSYIPIDLNCLLYKYETDFVRAYEIFEDAEAVVIWKGRAAKRARTVRAELWDQEKGFFFDLDYTNGKKSKIWSLAGYYTLWAKLANPQEAKQIAAHLDKFTNLGGLTATARPNELPHSDVPHQWAYPNGWAPLHWIVIEGLQKYGFTSEANAIVRKWLETNLRYYERHGVFREAYNVVDHDKEPKAGVYPPQLGFGWTNGVFVDLAKKHLSTEELSMV
jgi:alpha,alpha-trehalase